MSEAPRTPIAVAGPSASRGRLYSHEDLRARGSDPQLVIVNVLPRAAFEEARIPGSLHLPVDEIPARARTVVPDLRREIAVYCGGPT